MNNNVDEETRTIGSDGPPTASPTPVERDIITTDAGLPRPRTDDGRYPIPWNADARSLGNLISSRSKVLVRGAHCQVCGERLDPAKRALMFVRTDEADARLVMELRAGWKLRAADMGLLHVRCAALALRYCPVLKRDRKAGELFLFLAPTHSGIEFYARECDRLPLELLDGVPCPE